MQNKLSFNNIFMSFYDLEKETKVLEDLTFNVKEGEICVLLGPSGCGKSTILNLVSNIIKPTKGIIMKPASIGYMFQKDNLLDWLNVLDNVLIGLKINKTLTKEKVDYAKELLTKYGLKDFIYSFPNTLSGGMRQRVALIRAIILNPEMILLDEPFSALDSQTRIKVSSDIYEIIKELNMTTILVTHDVIEAIMLADKIIILSNRPATLIKEIDIEINDLKPEKRRNHQLFNTYFDIVWNDIND